jgi:plastocyanin
VKLFSLALIFVTASALGSQSALAATHTVKIEGMTFEPSLLKVKVGDTIVWANEDFFPHTVTALDKSFNSKNILASRSWTFKASRPGTFPYKCLYHLPMKATLVVE